MEIVITSVFRQSLPSRAPNDCVLTHICEERERKGTFIDGPVGAHAPHKGSDSKLPQATQLISFQLSLWLREGRLLSKQSLEPADRHVTRSLRLGLGFGLLERTDPAERGRAWLRGVRGGTGYQGSGGWHSNHAEVPYSWDKQPDQLVLSHANYVLDSF